MRRNIARVVRKTEHWLHRSLGHGLIKLPYYRKGDVKKIRICGTGSFSDKDFHERWKITSAEDGESDRLDVRLGSRNLLNYALLPKHFKANIPAKNTLSTPSCITWTPNSTEFVYPLIDSTFVKFKPMRIYTFACNITYPTGASGRLSTGFCFMYTDGTHEEIFRTTQSYSNIKIAAASDGLKSLLAIGVLGPTNVTRYSYAVSHFGVYEGDVTDEGNPTDPYVAPETVSIPLDAPLRGIAGACDMLELTEGIYQRNVEYVRFDSADGFEKTDTPHVFSTRLPTLVRDDLELECPFPVIAGGEGDTDSTWVSVGEDRESLLLHLPGCEELSELEEYLSTSGFGVAYAMQETIEKRFTASFTETDDKRWLMLDVNYDPDLFYAEYI